MKFVKSRAVRRAVGLVAAGGALVAGLASGTPSADVLPFQLAGQVNAQAASLTVTPSDGLVDSQTVAVAGTEFGANKVTAISECAVLSGNIFCGGLTTAVSNGAGAISKNYVVKQSFTGTQLSSTTTSGSAATASVDCVATQCYIGAVSSAGIAAADINFAATTTTTAPTTTTTSTSTTSTTVPETTTTSTSTSTTSTTSTSTTSTTLAPTTTTTFVPPTTTTTLNMVQQARCNLLLGQRAGIISRGEAAIARARNDKARAAAIKSLQSQLATNDKALKANKCPAAPPWTPPSQGQTAQTYTVKPGDSLSSIARHLLGDGNRYGDLFQANASQIRVPSLIHPGQILTIPQT
jgi:LysM repeat protein